MSDPIKNSPERSPYWLRLPDQAIVGGAALVGLLVLAGLWLVKGGAQGRLSDIERQPQREVSFQVDINTADWPELSLLPNVGQTLACRIVEARQQHGPFASVDELRRVRGIGPKTLENIRPYLKPIPPQDARPEP